MSGFIHSPELRRVSLHGEPGQASLAKPPPFQKLPEFYSHSLGEHPVTAHSTQKHTHRHRHRYTHTQTHTQTHTHRHTHTHTHTRTHSAGGGSLAPPHALPTIGPQSRLTCSEFPARPMPHKGCSQSPPMSSGQVSGRGE